MDHDHKQEAKMTKSRDDLYLRGSTRPCDGGPKPLAEMKSEQGGASSEFTADAIRVLRGVTVAKDHSAISDENVQALADHGALACEELRQGEADPIATVSLL